MDENSNPEWKQMLRGSSSGRKALEYIAELEQRNESLEEKARQWDTHNCTTHAMNLAQKNRNLEQQLGEMAELINYLRPLAKSAELELYESFISGMERAAEIVKSRLTNNDAKPYYEVWNSALYGAETAIRAELEPVTRPSGD